MKKIKDIGFHGQQRHNFFEGWYYKMVLEDTGRTVALIPGISKNSKDPHAFIQIFISPDMIFKYVRFDSYDFSVNNDPFCVKIKNHEFSLTTVKITYKDHELDFSINCSISDITPIHTSIYAPTIMGPFHYLPRMQCNHGIISMIHWLNGTMILNQESFSFSQQKGYIEKDWGTSFPRKYVWCQSNNFTDPHVSVFLSIATIPMMLFEFEGLIANITIHNKEYRFATYTFATFSIETIDDYTRKVTLNKGEIKAELIIHSPTSIALISPKKGSMNNMIKEGLEGTISLTLYKDNNEIFHDIGVHSGVEFSGY